MKNVALSLHILATRLRAMRLATLGLQMCRNNTYRPLAFVSIKANRTW